jgi:hypothetical protein
MAGGRPRRQEAFCDIYDTYAERVFLKKPQKAPRKGSDCLGFFAMVGHCGTFGVLLGAQRDFLGHGCASGGG